MLAALRIILAVLGISAIFVSASMLALGAQETVAAAERGFAAMSHTSGAFDATWSATIDSQLRFYAAFWGAWGILLVVVVTNTEPHLDQIPWLAAVMFAGGLGRAVSYFMVGPPHPFFLALMASELLAPPVIVLLWWQVRRRQA